MSSGVSLARRRLREAEVDVVVVVVVDEYDATARGVAGELLDLVPLRVGGGIDDAVVVVVVAATLVMGRQSSSSHLVEKHGIISSIKHASLNAIEMLLTILLRRTSRLYTGTLHIGQHEVLTVRKA